MLNLHEQIQQCFEGRVCLIGLGNVDQGDDGVGVRLAEALAQSQTRREPPDCSLPDPDLSYTVVNAATVPERVIGRLADDGFDHIIFLDAVDFGGLPGAVVFLNADEMAARFPQVSTHKLSLGLLAKRAEANGRTKAWLLGVQPESLQPGRALTPTVQATVGLLCDLLHGVSKEVMA